MRSAPRAVRSFPLGSPHACLIHAEIMRDLMPHGVRYHVFQFLRISRRSFMGTLVDGDLVGHGEAVAYAARGERMSLIQAEQPGTLRLPFDDIGVILKTLAKSRRDAALRERDQGVEFVFRKHGTYALSLRRCIMVRLHGAHRARRRPNASRSSLPARSVGRG
jgi:hypothetical protein